MMTLLKPQEVYDLIRQGAADGGWQGFATKVQEAVLTKNKTITWSDIVSTVNTYNDVLYSDEYSEVRPGCDCGCGGDMYTDNLDAWDEMVKNNEETIQSIKELCYNLNIEYDGVNNEL